MPSRRILALLGLTSLALTTVPSLAAQKDDDRWLRECQHDRDYGERERFCEVRHSGFKPSGAVLTIESDENGGIEIEGWDRDSVAISARIETEASTEEDARALAREVRIEASASSVKAVGSSSGRHQHWSAMLVLMVPRKIGLQAETVNGPLSVDGVASTMELSAQNGPVELTRVGGDVRARVGNGPLTVTLNGSSWDGKGLDAESVNGPVDLGLPEGYNAELETGTVNGPMTLGMPLTVTLNGRVRDRIHTTLGKGGAPVRVVTTNGPIMIRRARD